MRDEKGITQIVISEDSNIENVKEIVKETEKSSYLDEDSKKTYREKRKQEEKIREELRYEQKKRKQLATKK